MAVQTKPQIVIPTEVEAIATANRWLHQEIGMALHVTSATFDPVSTYWRLPVEMAYPDKGTLGVIGDLFLHAMTGTFGGSPDPNEFRRRADTLATLIWNRMMLTWFAQEFSSSKVAWRKVAEQGLKVSRVVQRQAPLTTRERVKVEWVTSGHQDSLWF